MGQHSIRIFWWTSIGKSDHIRFLQLSVSKCFKENSSEIANLSFFCLSLLRTADENV